MAQITEKELTALSDLLGMEENLVAKYKQVACTTADGKLKEAYVQMAQRHQQHYDELYASMR